MPRRDHIRRCAVYFQYLSSGVSVHGEALKSIRLTGPSEVGLRAAHGAAMRREYADMPLSGRGGDEYLALRRQRREDLESLLRGGIDEVSREKALDLVCAICEEPWWAQRIDAVLDDGAHPKIDLMAAETACLIAWTLHEGGFVLSVRAHIVRELRRRIFMPLIAHDDYACMQPGTPRALSVMCLAMFAALIAETDASRLMAFIRRAAKAADDMIAAGIRAPLKDALADWTQAAAFWHIARILTGRQHMTRALPLPEWLDTALIAHLGGGVFVDRFGGALADGVNGADIYFLGKMAGDAAMMALGASLYRENAVEASALNVRLIADHSMEMLTGSASAPRFKHGSLPDGSLMCARGGGAFITLHAGGRGNAGGLCAYMDDAPVLYACRTRCVAVNGQPLTDVPGAGDCDLDDERADMSVDMTPALPRDAGVRFMQRTVMLERRTGVTRVIDMVECDAQGVIEYVFESPEKPVNVPGGAALGRALFTWDGGMEARTENSGDMHRISLAYRLMPGSNLFNFMIEPAE